MLGAWPYSVGILVKWVTFLSSLRWAAARADLGVGGVSFLEILILYELWAGERWSWRRPSNVIDGLDVQFQCPLFLLVQALIFGVLVGLKVAYWEHCVLSQEAWEGSCLVVLELITVEGKVSTWAYVPTKKDLVYSLDELLILFRYPANSGLLCLMVFFR